MSQVTLRPYTLADEDAAIELWRRTWAQHYPHIDFNARVAWWRERWRQELVPVAQIVLAEIDSLSNDMTQGLPHTPFIPAHSPPRSQSGFALAKQGAGIQSRACSPREPGPGSPLARGRTGKALVGFVTVDPKTGYLDQIVVVPEQWGSGVARALLDEAKRLSPGGIDLLVNKDNARAIRFYAKHGFVHAGEGRNPVSGIKVDKMEWRPRSASS